MFSMRRVALVEGDRDTAEMLHTFFRVMDLECSMVRPDSSAVPTLRRLAPDVLILDLDLPDLRALEIARELHTIPTILLTSCDPQLIPIDAPVMRKPRDRFEELLRLFEMVLALEA
jgi:DNA-binding response OmpR family regulator